MGRLCSKRNGGSLTISPTSAASIVLDSFNHTQPCRVEIATPATHHISMLFTPRRRAIDKMTAEGARGVKQCPLTISYVSFCFWFVDVTKKTVKNWLIFWWWRCEVLGRKRVKVGWLVGMVKEILLDEGSVTATLLHDSFGEKTK